MNSAKLESRVREVVVHSLALEGQTIDLDDDFTAHHGADEIDIIKLGMDLEDAFGIRIDDDELGHFRTLEYCIQAVTQALEQRV